MTEEEIKVFMKTRRKEAMAREMEKEKHSMKVIELIHQDGSVRMAQSALVPYDFDVQEWANKRRASLKLLNVVEIRERHINPTKS